ncbi:MAG TPA: alpha/beta hydrolase [candidate division Zixibacteria bacterium]|nr:alpha/beta hydrolase [candidate division Zixibacteria bacterium]
MKREELNISYYENSISAVLFLPEEIDKKYPVVCKAHGLISNEFDKEEILAEILTDNGIAYFVFHFTGFYSSPGESSIQTSLDDLDKIITFLANHPKVDPMKIGLYGVSLGAAIATCHASRDPRVSTIALQAPLYDFAFVVNYPEFDALWDGLAAAGLVRLPEKGVKEKLISDIRGNNPIECVNKISPRPILIIAGAEDKFIPMNGIKELYAKAIDPKLFEIIEGADHNLTKSDAKIRTFNLLRDFFVKQLLLI